MESMPSSDDACTCVRRKEGGREGGRRGKKGERREGDGGDDGKKGERRGRM